MAQGSPGKDIHNGESGGVIALHQARDLLCVAITSLKMSHSILLWQSLPCHLNTNTQTPRQSFPFIRESPSKRDKIHDLNLL